MIPRLSTFIYRDQQTVARGPTVVHPPFCKLMFLGTQSYPFVGYRLRLLCAAVTELSGGNCYRGPVSCKACNISYLVLYRKSFSTSVLQCDYFCRRMSMPRIHSWLLRPSLRDRSLMTYEEEGGGI